MDTWYRIIYEKIYPFNVMIYRALSWYKWGHKHQVRTINKSIQLQFLVPSSLILLKEMLD